MKIKAQALPDHPATDGRWIRYIWPLNKTEDPENGFSEENTQDIHALLDDDVLRVWAPAIEKTATVVKAMPKTYQRVAQKFITIWERVLVLHDHSRHAGTYMKTALKTLSKALSMPETKTKKKGPVVDRRTRKAIEANRTRAIDEEKARARLAE